MNQEKADGRLLLLIVGILTLIATTLGLFGCYNALANPQETLKQLKSLGPSSVPQYMLSESSLYSVSMILIIPNLLKFICSIFYIKWANEPEKAKTLKIIITVDLILSLAVVLLPIFVYGSSISSSILINIIASFIFPILLFIGATRNENMLKD